MFQYCFKGVSMVLKEFFKDVERVFQGCCKSVSRVFQACSKGVLWVFIIGCSRTFDGGFYGVSMKFKG